MNWLVVAFALSIGWVPSGNVYNYDRYEEPFLIDGEPYGVVLEAIDLENTFYVDLETEIEFFKYVFIGGKAQIYMFRNLETVAFSPRSLSSFFWAGVRYGPLEFKWTHVCTHPVSPGEFYFTAARGLEWTVDSLVITIRGEF